MNSDYLRKKADVARRVFLAHHIANDLEAAADELDRLREEVKQLKQSTGEQDDVKNPIQLGDA
jgi:predicted translin family RNA/ssDNA-binding protein